jgi:hypothetical protein
MGTQTTAGPALADAITAVEQANTNYQGAVVQTSNDQAVADAAQAKADAAKAVVTNDQAGQQSAAGVLVGALQSLIGVATAQIASLAPPAPPA